MNLHGATALVTGSNRGIGHHFVVELLARVRTLLRRGGQQLQETTLQLADLELDLLRHIRGLGLTLSTPAASVGTGPSGDASEERVA